MPVPERTPATFVQILERVWWRLDRALDERSLRASARYYVAEALMNGTTVLVDHHESPDFIEGSLDVLADVCHELGVRALLCYGATERNRGRDEAREGLRECARFVHANRRPLVRGLVGLHASFTVSDETLEEARDLCRDLGVVSHVHVAEDHADVDDARGRGYDGPLERLLRHELLGTELRDALQRAPGTGTAVAIVAAAIAPSLGDARGAEQAYAESGLKGFESKLTRDYLQHVTSTRPHRAVRRFFAAFIDLRNLMTLYKHLRWQIDDPAAFVPGGTLDTGRLREASAQGDGEYLDSAVRRVTGEPAAPAAAGQVALESRLLASLTRMLRKAGRDGDDVDLVLDYVWCTYVHARNRALYLHAGGMDAEVLQPELIA